MTVLLSPVNVSEGRDDRALDAIADAYTRAGARLLDVHSDPDHHRTVLTLAGEVGGLAEALVAGAREATRRIDLRTHEGIHPHVGAVDVVPVVHLDDDRRGAACAEALVTADELGRAGLPVYLYGALAGGRTRAQLREGGLRGLQGRGTRADFGPQRPGEEHGATLVAARPPLVAFNLEVETTLEHAKRIAAEVRRLEGVTALGLWLGHRDTAQVSANVEDHRATPLATLLEAVRRHATVTAAELVGLAPEAAFAGWPDELPVRNRRTVEEALGGA